MLEHPTAFFLLPSFLLSLHPKTKMLRITPFKVIPFERRAIGSVRQKQPIFGSTSQSIFSVNRLYRHNRLSRCLIQGRAHREYGGYVSDIRTYKGLQRYLKYFTFGKYIFRVKKKKIALGLLCTESRSLSEYFNFSFYRNFTQHFFSFDFK